MVDKKQILVTRSSMAPFEEYCEEIRDLWDSRWLTNCGVKHKQLELDVRDYLGVDLVDLFVNGHAALECAIEAFGLGRDGRDEVITTPFTFVSTSNAISRKGLKPVFCDVREDNYTIDPEKIEGLVTDKTCAIIPVHVYGCLCDVDAIDKIAKKYNLAVIYDAAHAFGVKRNGVGVGTFGDASMFSFHATKVFNSIEGGCITHADDALSEQMNQWRNFGISSTEECSHIGGNYKMNEFAAAMGICNLRHLDSEIAKRRIVAEHYWDSLRDVPGLSFCEPGDGIEYNYAYLPMRVQPELFGATRDDVFAALAKEGIGARKYFYPLACDFKCYEDDSPADVPIAREVASQILTLPMFADLDLEDVDHICTIVKKMAR